MPSTQTNPSIHRIARRAAVRVVMRSWLAAGAGLLVWSLPTALVMIVLLRQGLPRIGVDTGMALPWLSWWMLLLLSLLVPLVVSAVRLRRQWLSEVQGAGVLDDRFGLESRIRSAIELEEGIGPEEVGFVEIAQRQAAEAIGRVDLRQIGDRASWSLWSLNAFFAVLCVIAGIWMPALVAGSFNGAGGVSVIPGRAIAQINAVQDELGDQLGEDRGEPDEVSQTQAELEALREELAEGVTSESEADARAAAMLDKLADELDRSAQQEQEQAKALSEAVQQALNAQETDVDQNPGLDTESASSVPEQESAYDSASGAFDDFARAMSEQRFDDAGEALKDLQAKADELSQQERDALAEQFEQLADSIEQEPIEQDPADSAQDERATPESDTSDPVDDFADSIRQESQRMRQGDQDQSDESDPSDPSEQSSDRSEQSSSDQSTEPSPKDRESQPSPSPQGNQERQADPTNEDQQQDGQETQSEQGENQDQSSTNNEKTGERRTPEQGESTRNDQSKTQRTDQNQQNQAETETEPREQGQQDQPGEQGQDRTAEQVPSAEQSDDQASSQETDQSEQEKQGAEQDDSASPEQSDQPGRDSDPRQGSPRSLQERLEDMHRRSQRSREQEDRAQRIREQAKELIDPEDSDRSPESSGTQRDDGIARPPRGGGADASEEPDQAPVVDPNDVREFIPVDGRDSDASGGGEPMGKWYAPEGDGQSPRSSEHAARRLRQAAQDAQRAIDQQQVPRRYRHLVREVFKRVDQRADQLEQQRSVAPQGKDAVPSNRSGGSGSTGGDG